MLSAPRSSPWPYAAAAALVLVWEPGRQVFWTCAIAALPLLWVTFGFAAWRRACPLAWFARLAARLGREGARRAPARLRTGAPLLQLGLMVAALTARHLWINGEAWPLVVFLGGLAAAAAVSGFAWSGRTWCHLLCPVGVVERIYTDPLARAGGPDSACRPCTGCVRRCPDLDQERAHRTGLFDPARRLATLAWPGVVLGFYLVWRVESGGWEAYFSGAWAHQPAPSPGSPLPGLSLLPRAVWIPGLLLGCGATSALALDLSERLARALGARAEPTRRRLLGSAGALALALFYLFAGQPTLRQLPDPLRAAAGAACALGVLSLLLHTWRHPARPGAAAAGARRLPVACASGSGELGLARGGASG